MKVNVELQAKWANLAKIKQEVDAAFQGQTIGGSGTKGKFQLQDFLGANQSASFLARNPHLARALSDVTQKGMTEGAKKAAVPMAQSLNNQWKNILAGSISMLANPYLAARAFMGGFGIGGGGGHGGGGGMITSPFGMGGGAGNFLPVAIALTGVKVAAEALRAAFEHMVEAFKRGSKLFTDAAKTGQSTGRLFQLQYALSSVGIDPSQADQLLLNAQFQRFRRSGGGSFARSGGPISTQGSMTEFEGIMLGARRGVNQSGELQQLVNLSKQAKEAWQDSAVDARIAGETARTMFRVTFEGARIQREWHALWTNMATDLSNVLIPVMHGISSALKSINDNWQTIKGVVEVLTHLPFGTLAGGHGGKNSFGKAIGSGGNVMQSMATQWNKMGFISNGLPDQQIYLLRQINRNLNTIREAIGKFATGDIFGGLMQYAGAIRNYG